jgi:prevent-host-death family protein
MHQVPIRELNQDTAEVLARVERGETVEITRRGRPIARLVPIGPDTMADLVASGVVTPPTITDPIPMPTVTAVAGSKAGDLLSSLRDEERW